MIPIVREVLDRVAAKHGVTSEEIIGRSQVSKIINARHAAVRMLAEERPNWSLHQIGHPFGRDHTTILYILKKAGIRQGRTRSMPA